MKDQTVLMHLESLSERMGLRVRYEKFDRNEFSIRSGLCRLGAQKYVLIEEELPTREKIRELCHVLSHHDLEGHYILPYVRRLILTEREKAR